MGSNVHGLKRSLKTKIHTLIKFTNLKTSNAVREMEGRRLPEKSSPNIFKLLKIEFKVVWGEAVTVFLGPMTDQRSD